MLAKQPPAAPAAVAAARPRKSLHPLVAFAAAPPATAPAAYIAVGQATNSSQSRRAGARELREHDSKIVVAGQSNAVLGEELASEGGRTFVLPPRRLSSSCPRTRRSVFSENDQRRLA